MAFKYNECQFIGIIPSDEQGNEGAGNNFDHFYSPDVYCGNLRHEFCIYAGIGLRIGISHCFGRHGIYRPYHDTDIQDSPLVLIIDAEVICAYNVNMWIVFALLSAVFAALTSILAKIGIQDVNSNLATAVRTIVVLVMAWVIVFITGKQNDLAHIGQKNLLFLVLSGIATGLSWLCYYRALQIGEASKVIPVDKFSLVIGMVMAFVILKETITIKTIIGGVFITIGTFVLIF